MTSKIVQRTIRDRSGGFDVVALKEKLDAVRKSNWRDSGVRKKTTFSPSVVGGYNGTCPRYWYYAFNGAYFDEKFKPESAEAMDNGTASHGRMESVYSEAGVNAIVEKELKLSDPPIRGFADVICEINGVQAVGDYKTINSSGFHYRIQSMKPSEAHYLQILIYMKILGLSDGFLHYQCKDTHQELFIPVKMSERAEKYIDYVFGWMRDVKNATELPERPFTKSSPNCRYCPLSKDCWKDEDGTPGIGKLKVQKP